MDQPGKVANPARGQLNREKYSPVPVRAWQYNIGEMLFLTSCVLVANPKKTTLHGGANRARGLLSREKRTKRKSLAAYRYPPPKKSERF